MTISHMKRRFSNATESRPLYCNIQNKGVHRVLAVGSKKVRVMSVGGEIKTILPNNITDTWK